MDDFTGEYYNPTIDTTWMNQAECIGLSYLFFPPQNHERPDRHDMRVARARAVCATCTVVVECREYAAINREDYGVWGGVELGTRDSRDHRNAIVEVRNSPNPNTIVMPLSRSS